MGSTLLKHDADHNIFKCKVCGLTVKTNCEELFCPNCQNHIVFPPPNKKNEKPICDLCGMKTNTAGYQSHAMTVKKFLKAILTH